MADLATKLIAFPQGSRRCAQAQTKGVQTNYAMKANTELDRTLEAEGMITVAHAAELLRGLRPKVIYLWVRAKAVRHRRVGRRLYVHRGDVEQMLGLKVAR